MTREGAHVSREGREHDMIPMINRGKDVAANMASFTIHAILLTNVVRLPTGTCN